MTGGSKILSYVLWPVDGKNDYFTASLARDGSSLTIDFPNGVSDLVPMNVTIAGSRPV